MAKTDVFGARTPFPGKDGVSYYRLAKLQEDGIANIDRLPFSIKILLEAVLRNHDDYVINADDVKKLANWEAVEEVSDSVMVMMLYEKIMSKYLVRTMYFSS